MSLPVTLSSPADGRLLQSTDYYTLSLAVGTPPQAADVFLTTSSVQLWVYGQRCPNETWCTHNATGYNPTTSSSSSPSVGEDPDLPPNEFGISDNELQGGFARDTVRVGSHAAEMLFGEFSRTAQRAERVDACRYRQ